MTEERAFELLQDLNGMTREEAIEVLELHLIEFKHDFGWNRTTIKAMEMAVEALEEPERKTGKWILNEKESEKHIEKIYDCSACMNFEAWGETELYKYCPNCGAKMEGDIDGND